MQGNQAGKFQKGYTLMEVLIVLGLLAIVLAIVLPLFYRTLQKYRAETAVEQIQMNLRFARLSAVKKRIQYRVIFNATPTNTYHLETNPSRDGITWETYNYANTTIPSNVKILTGGITDVTYSPRGSASINGGNSIRLQSLDFGSGDSQNIIYRINVYASGGVTKTAE